MGRGAGELDAGRWGALSPIVQNQGAITSGAGGGPIGMGPRFAAPLGGNSAVPSLEGGCQSAQEAGGGGPVYDVVVEEEG